MHKSNFWDKMWKVDRQKDRIYIILRVSQFGTQKDFDELKKYYQIDEILTIIQDNHHNIDDLTRNFFNIKYGLNLPLKKNLNEITSGYSIRFQEKIFIE